MIGAVLAGGAGRRMGRASAAGKAGVLLAGRPLVSYPIAALEGACERVVVVCKPATLLPELAGVERWDEPRAPRHPLTGIVHALERAGAPVLVCAADMPFVTAEACRSLAAAASRSRASATVACAGGVVEPVFAVYSPDALEALRGAPPDVPLRDVVAALGAVRVALPARLLTSVNTPEALAVAEVRLRGV